jgi:two-component system nitrogen regulation sensor histidine kinase NtrY
LCPNSLPGCPDQKWNLRFINHEQYMNKTQRIAALCFLVFLSISIGIDSYNNQEAHLRGYAEKLSDYIAQKEAFVKATFERKEEIWDQVIELDPETVSETDSILASLERISSLPISLYFYKNDSLVFWSNSRVAPSLYPKGMANQADNVPYLTRLKNGYFLFYKEEFSKGPDERYAVAYVPVKNAFRLESSYLENGFPTEEPIPAEVEISFQPTDFPVLGTNNLPLFYLEANEPFKDAPRQKWLLLFMCLTFLSVATLINSVARRIVQRFRPWLGAAFLIVTIAILRFITLQLSLSEKFSNLEIFSRAFYTPVLNYSLGDLLLDILLLLWLMVFFHREFKVKQMVQISRPWQYMLTTLNYFSVILGILMVTSVFKSLVLDSGVTFDFDNVFQLNIYSIFAIFGVIFLLFALFLFSHRMMLTIQKTGLPRKWRMASLVTSLLVSLPVIYFTDLNLPFIRVVMGASIYILLFDLYIDNKSPSLVWLGIWLLFFASSSAAILFKYNEDKDIITRYQYAQELSNWRDSIAEREFEKLVYEVEKDSLLRYYLFQYEAPDRSLMVQRRIDNIYSDFNYLFNIYSYKNQIVPSLDTVLQKGIFGEMNMDLAAQYDSGEKSGREDIYMKREPGQMMSYMAKVSFNGKKEGGEPYHLYLKAQKRLREPSMVYTELILTQYFKNLKNLDFYDYTIFENGKMVEYSGRAFEHSLKEFSLPEDKQFGVFIIEGRSELIFKADNGTTIVIGRQVRNLLKAISLFSYLFVLLAVTVFFIAIVNTFTRVLPEVLKLTVWKKPSLKNKIQLAIILTIVTSFVMIGWVTVIYFRNTSNDYHENRLLRKLSSVLADAEHEIQIRMEAGEKDMDLGQLVQSLAPIHRMDINVYDLSGNLITSTELDIYNKGIVAPKMGSVAYWALSRFNRNDKIQEEGIGKLEYKSAYVPLRQPNGKIMGYIGLPYYSKQRNLRDDVYEFMGTLLNVYVFLLLIASGIAILVANNITKPIAVIGERFRRFKLGTPEPLVWNSKDELGELIDDYNRMIAQVDDYTEKLKKSEREGAWRIMAQQVAHEIKNPLTPMRLSIQYLQRALKNDPEHATQLFERVSKTLMEQIESLVQISTAFSNFAKMPKPNNKPLWINDLVESVYLLFAENKKVEINMFLPEKKYQVFADKNQMMRVLNNIISNAIQAIPDERNGKIDISVFEKEENVVIKVSDNGIGIAEDMQDKVFAPHFTTRSSGMGLGLAMCKDIVEMGGGKIYFKTVPHKGTDFFVEIPKL